MGGLSTPAPSTAVHALPFSLEHNVHYRTLLAALSLFVPNVTQRFAVCRKRQTTPFGVRARRPTTVPIMCVMFGTQCAGIFGFLFGRREGRGLARFANGPAAFPLRVCSRVVGPRIFPAPSRRKTLSPPRHSLKSVSSFSSRRLPPGNKSREGPHPFPRLLSHPPQGGAGQQRLSASSRLRSRVFSVRARPAFDRASASGGLAFRRLFRLRLQSFFTPPRRLPVRRSRCATGAPPLSRRRADRAFPL